MKSVPDLIGSYTWPVCLALTHAWEFDQLHLELEVAFYAETYWQTYDKRQRPSNSPNPYLATFGRADVSFNS